MDDATTYEAFDASDAESDASAKGSYIDGPAHDNETCQTQPSGVHDRLDMSGITAVDHAHKDDTDQMKSDFSSIPIFDEAEAQQESSAQDAEPILSDVESAPKSVNGGLKKGTKKPSQQQITFHRMHKFTLYETNARYWITGSDITDKYYKLLKIDRTAPPGQLSVFEDDIVYSKKEVTQLLTTIDEGNKATGGLRVKCSFWGILGFIKFTDCYYVLLITKRQQVAMIGGHYIYGVEGTELVPLTTGAGSRFARERNAEEGRFLSILNNLDLTRSFYFSYSYDITRTLQYNITRQRNALNRGIQQPGHDYNDMFVWNHHLLSPAVKHLKNAFDWCLPIIHGFIDQSSLDVFGRSIYITIIGRRSRFFAGARFLKRGANDLGYVANDVETEQIVSEMLTTSFHAPGPKMFTNPNYTSYVHHRGSIPLYWSQDNSGVSPKPDIDLNVTDPFYQPAAMHFDDLFKRYGCPIYVLNLIKSRERTARESKLLTEFQNALNYLNQFLPEDKKIQYKAFDMSRAAKTRGGDVIGTLEIIAEEIMQKTGFFHNGDVEDGLPEVQNGIARTNCIDCLDRTNAAQFVIGKRALGHQLRALGVIPTADMEYDSDAVNVFTHMFHDHGDTIAIQYGGSHLVNTMATYRKINHWHTQSRDMVESFKRYYHNSFLDSQRQEAYNLFLGNYIWAQGQPMLWDLSTDYYLHHTDPKKWLDRARKSYINWFTPEHLERRTLPPTAERGKTQKTDQNLAEYDDYWLEYYRPLAVSSFVKVYSYRMNTNHRFLPERPSKDTKYDFSPFTPRIDLNRNSPDSPEKKPPRKGVTIVDPQSDNEAGHQQPSKSSAATTIPESILRDTTTERTSVDPENQKSVKIADKAAITQMTLNRIYDHSLNPSVTAEETTEYERYISHPFKIPLVVSSELPPETNLNLDFVDYVNSGRAGVDSGDEGSTGVLEPSYEDLAEFTDFLTVREDPLTVWEEDGGKKRYKAYRQWLKGKSLFKQSKVDPEFRQ
ncbi:hypothetical protein D6C93_00569 [Aureobasidium pullulans]|uniref:SAC domain-containing protein n=1 Tax=Aureobasidium pullulans TaxID=5580 RepID=A0A4S9SAA2_AURPU|nr:hypothetical protein D6D24_00355 [Aureobasidium pullulans]THZ08350.1 hypothetical protein D6C93_00569 [Aureobasidium pullulans]